MLALRSRNLPILRVPATRAGEMLVRLLGAEGDPDCLGPYERRFRVISYQSFSKAARFNDLVESVQHCDLCPRLGARRKVLSSANGSMDSRVLFVAEAPGRLGADRTGVPLYGDNNFEVLLGNIGWRREEVFITNAVLCNPKQENGNNGTPTQEEIANCSAYLEMVIALINPDVIVTLGTTALKALAMLSPHGIELRDGVAQTVPWRNTRLFPLYHPRPRAILHRSLAKQRSDFMLLSKIVHRDSLNERIPAPRGRGCSPPYPLLLTQFPSFHSLYHARMLLL